MDLKSPKKTLNCEDPGEIEGTKQSGVLNFKLADIVKDRPILDAAKKSAEKIFEARSGSCFGRKFAVKRIFNVITG